MGPSNLPPHNRHLMGDSEFLYSLRMIRLPLNISEKYKLGGAETHCLQVCQYDTRPTHFEEQHRPFKQTGTTSIFSFRYQSCT